MIFYFVIDCENILLIAWNYIAKNNDALLTYVSCCNNTLYKDNNTRIMILKFVIISAFF